MSHPTDPTPRPGDPTPPPPKPPQPVPADDEFAEFDFGDVADLDLASLSSSGIRLTAADEAAAGIVPPLTDSIPPLAAGAFDPDAIHPLAAEGFDAGGVSFDLPDAPTADSWAEDRTVGVSRDDLPALFAAGHAVDHVEDDGHFVPRLEEADTGAFGDPHPAVPAAPFAEFVPDAAAESVPLGDDVPAAEAASASDVYGGAAPPAESASASGLVIEAVPEAEGASSSGIVWDAVPDAESASSSAIVAAAVPGAAPVSSPDVYGAAVPAAEAVSSSGLFDSAPGLGAAVPADAAPASGGSASSLFGDGVSEAEAVLESDVFEAAPASDVYEAFPADPAGPGSSVALGTGGPVGGEFGHSVVTPVAPASGWFDSQAGDAPVPPAARPHVPPPPDAIDAALADPGLVLFRHHDGSDLFGPAPAPPAHAADHSDVIGATAGGRGDAAPAVPYAAAGRPSDIALTFDQPPGGSTTHDPDAADDLPVAEELPADSGHLFEATPAADDLFDSFRLAAADAEPSYEAADYGATPAYTVDASSILGELGGPDAPPAPVDDSGVRLDAPGVDATVTDEPMPAEFRDYGEVTEFDDPAPAEPAPAVSAEAADEGDAVDFSDHPDLKGADSGSLHLSAAASAELIDFDTPAEPARPDVTARNPYPDDDADLAGLFDETLGHDAAAGPVSGVLFRGDEPAAFKSKAAPRSPRPAPAPPAAKDDPSLVVDWVAESGESDSFVAAAAGPHAAPESAADISPARKPTRGSKVPTARDADDLGGDDRTDPTRAHRPATDPAPVSRRGLAGLALGLLLGVGASAGVYVSGLVPNHEAPKGGPVAGVTPGAAPLPPTPTNPPAAAAGVADAQAALNAGDPDRALRVIEAAPPGANPAAGKSTVGQARLFSYLREVAATGGAAAAGDPKLTQSRADLEAAADDADAAKTAEGEKAAVRAIIHLGLAHQVAGDRAKAREVYEDGKKRFPKSAAVFESALDRLDATDPDAGKTSRRPTRAEAERLLFAVLTLAVADPDAAPATDPEEAAPYFWKAVKAANAGKYDEATDLVKTAKKKHVARAAALSGRGLNPVSDPLEEVFPKCCDDLVAYWELRKALYKHPAVGPQVNGASVKKALDQLAVAEKKSVDLATTVTTLETKLEKAAEAVTTAEKDLKAEQEVVAKLEKDVKAEKEVSAKADKELKAAKESVEKLDKTAKAAKEAAAELTADLKTAGESLAEERKSRKDADAALDSIAKELRAAKLIPETADSAAVVAATRAAVSRATGPDLSKLVPPDLSAVAGTGLTTGHLLDLAARVSKSEAGAKAAAAAVTKTTAKYEAEIAEVKAGNEAAVKALKEAAATDAKNLADKFAVDAKATAAAHAAAVKKLTDANATLADKMTAEFAVEAKKRADEYDAAARALAAANDAKVKKLTDDTAAKVAALTAEAAAEREKAAAAEKRLRTDLSNALSPAASLDLWLPLLVELRRPADADPALDAAGKTLATAPADSDDAGKAHAVGGVARLLKGDKEGARAELVAARTAPAYKAAKGKPWAAAADAAFGSLDDPAFAARRAIDPATRKNPALAARFLDAGIVAYKDGRLADAETALADAARHNPDDAVTWYFLGAARWVAGKADLANADFRQGAERERDRTAPARTIDVALGPIQGPVRDALTAARP